MKIIFRGDKVKLIVVSEDFNSRLSCELSQLLSKHGGVLLLGNNIIEASYIDTPEYVITDIGAKLDNSIKNTISVEISKNGDIINEALIYNDSAGIKQRLNIGTDFKDDITLSSLMMEKFTSEYKRLSRIYPEKIYIRVK